MDDDLTPFDGLPDELRRMFEQLTGGDGPFAQGMPLMNLFGGGADPDAGPVDWKIARRAALQLAGEGDHSPDEAQRQAAAQALQIAEHWLDTSSLPAPPDAGRLHLASRGEWVDAALAAMRPLVEPVAAASTATMADLAKQQMEQLDLDEMGLGPLAGLLGSFDPSALLRPLGATMAGLQAGQVLGELAQHLLIGTELGLPTGPRSTALLIAPNIAETFGSWELDETEVMIVLSLHEAANRRLFHAVGWLEGHVHDLVSTFAEGTVVDVDQLQRMAQDLMSGVDPSDPEAMQEAMRSAAQLKLTPTPAQERVLERIQGVVALVGAWTRREVAAVSEGRLPSQGRIDEVLRRRRATRGNGEGLLASLLGLDLTPQDPTLGDHFVVEVMAALGRDGLRNAIAHPENLPDLAELDDPDAWLRRIDGGDSDVPDDLSSLLDDLGDAPVEPSADERTAALRDGGDAHDDGTSGDGTSDDGTSDDD